MSNAVVVELGCGNGRDAGFLAERSHFYFGVDKSAEAVRATRKKLMALALDESRWKVAEADYSQIDWDSFVSETLIVYGRFSIHSDDQYAEDRLLRGIAESRHLNAKVVLEARTVHDELYGVGHQVARHAFVSDHYRRFIDPVEFQDRYADAFSITDFVMGRGLAPFGAEDPIVMRIELTKAPPAN